MANSPNREDSPYKGLQPYTEKDREYFFGRERDQEIIISNLFASPLTVFYGASGVGKSSVLLAGVVPELKATPRLAVVVFREWQDAGFELVLKREVLMAISESAGREIQVNLALEFDEFLLACIKAFRGSLFFILDQFEEYFLYHPVSPQIEKFDAAFARAVNRQEISANFLLSMRDDGLSKLDRFQKRIPNLLNNMLRLEHLDRTSAAEAIRKPLDKYNELHANGHLRMGIEDELVNVLLTDLGAGKVTLDLTGQGKVESATHAERSTRIETPFLQVVLTRLWEEEKPASDHPDPRAQKLRLATYESLGKATTIVRTHLDKMMETESLAPHRDAAAALFHFLVTPGGQKIAHTPDDLASYTKLSPSEAAAVLNKLSHPEVRILRPIAPPPDQPGALRYEIFHDVLAPAILDWRARYMTVKEREEDKRLAEEQRRRADEEAKAARRFRRLSYALGAVCLIAVAAVGVAAAYAIKSQRLAEEGRALKEEGRALKEEGRALKAEAVRLNGVANDAQQNANAAQKAADRDAFAAKSAKAEAEAAQERADVALSQAVAARARAVQEREKVRGIQSALALSNAGQSLRAVRELESLLPLFKRTQDVCGEANVHFSIGSIYAEVASFSGRSTKDITEQEARVKGVDELDAALKLYSKSNVTPPCNTAERAAANLTRGELSFNPDEKFLEGDDQIEKAVEYFQQALELYRATGDVNGEISALEAFVKAYEYAGDDDEEALKNIASYREKLLPLYKKNDEVTAVARNLSALGDYYSKSDEKAEKEKALKFYLDLVSLHRNSGQRFDDKERAGTLRAVAGLYRSLGDPKKANEYGVEADRIAPNKPY